MVQILDSSMAGYTCDNYKKELQTTQGIQAAGAIDVRGRSLSWIKSTAYNPAAKIRMTSMHYCLNTSRGALILSGMAPEETFIRSEKIFYKVAAPLEARKSRLCRQFRRTGTRHNDSNQRVNIDSPEGGELRACSCRYQLVFCIDFLSTRLHDCRCT